MNLDSCCLRNGGSRRRTACEAYRLERLEARVLLAGLVAAYGFDEGSGMTVTDFSGIQNDGTINGASWTASGQFGGALQFDGVNDTVSVPDDDSLDLTTGMTIEAWIYPTATSGTRDVLIKEGSVDLYNLYARNGGGSPESNVFVGGVNRVAVGAPLAVNTWVHLAGTYDGTTLRLFVNGAEAATQVVGGAIATSSGALRIGGNALWGEYFQGRIDEVRVYNRALSASEIQTDMNTPVASEPPAIPPRVTSVSPRTGAMSVAVGTNLSVVFSEPMDPASINSSTIELLNPQNVPVPAAVTWNAATRTATLNPNSNLPSTTGYYIGRVQSGPLGVKDLTGAPLTADFRWYFTTGAPTFQRSTAFGGLTDPTVVRFSPDGRIFVGEKSGLIKIFDNLSDTTPTVFADLRTQVHNFWDRGLLGLALPPNFPASPYVYVLYSCDANIGGTPPKYGTAGQTSDPGPDATGNGALISGRLSRLQISGNSLVGGEQVLIHDWFQQFPSHSVGSIQFGPDGMLYASAGDGASFNYVDYGQTGNPGNDPVNQGGALRSQDLLSPADPTTLDGAVIRVDPATGAPVPGNPLYISGNDTNARRIIAHGFRNPFRFAFRPGTDEIWLGDVGWTDWEELNLIPSASDSTLDNFGWPAYEGENSQGGYDNQNLPLLEALYAQSGAVTSPYYTYSHGSQVVPGSGEPTGGSAISGVAFYEGGQYPAAYNNAVFFSDYSRGRLYVMFPAPDGLPDPANRAVVLANAGFVHLEIGPGGDLFYADLDDGTIQRVQFFGSNRPPVAVAQSDVVAGPAPLLVSFDGSQSSDPDAGDPLSYAWDLDDDGQFDDAATAQTQFTFTTGGNHTVRLRVTDAAGLFDIDTRVISVNNTAPVATIASPLPSIRWQVGQTINFVGEAADGEQGSLPASAYTWSLILHHNTHTHDVQDFVGVSSGSFVAPDHEYPSFLELELTVTDAGGLQNVTTVLLHPLTVNVTMQTSPPGLQVALNGTALPGPFTRTVIAGSTNSVSAAASQVVNGVTYHFMQWSDGGTPSHFLTPSFTSVLVAHYSWNRKAIMDGRHDLPLATARVAPQSPSTPPIRADIDPGTQLVEALHLARAGSSNLFVSHRFAATSRIADAIADMSPDGLAATPAGMLLEMLDFKLDRDQLK